ncbi:ABC transporter substrate-binding protein [Actinoplanes sp. LDG1-06]|uniref:ABC transporter substrate-binding protein n=1 Tax=Paractinoplanes ovalisporus TaxID=2810368 RepID=A0ABS2AHE7_9ACTN|nr:ABC transporter substrate-binding protein [Actinoplanes ovalisporus]MBM2619257.1 ABC transporter substrate-binding protein [Actinoplanes ovalisporus]
MPGKSPWKVAAAATTIVLLAAGCSGSSSEDTEVLPNSISIGIAEPSSLIPSNSIESSGSQVLASLFYPLVRFDANNAPYPVAAQSITKDKTNRIWTVRLKPGFTFSNGEPVVADNYIDAWNYGAYGPNGQLASYFYSRIDGYADLQSKDPDGDGPEKASDPKATKLRGLKKVNNLTFTVTLTEGFVNWDSVMGYDSFYPLPKAAFSGDGVLNKDFEQAPIGNGPFKMKGTWSHDEKITVEKVADFKGTVPKVNGITWKIYQDLGAQYADLVGGNLDIETKIPIENLASASGDLGARLGRTPSSAFSFVGFPMYLDKYKNPNVRRALSMAINRQEMTDQVFLGSETPATSFVSPVLQGAKSTSCGQWCEYNPTRAKQLYSAANGPKDIKISYNIDGGHKAWVDAMCNQIKASLAINCTGVGLPKLKDVLDRVKAGEDVGLIRLGWTMDYPLMESYLGPLYTSDGSSNYYGYKNSTFDSLVRQGSAALTKAESEKLWIEAEAQLVRDMPVLPLRFGQNVFGYSERVTDVTMDLYQKVDIYSVDIAG